MSSLVRRANQTMSIGLHDPTGHRIWVRIDLMPADPRHKFKSISEIVTNVVNQHLPAGDIDALSRQLDRINSCWSSCCSENLSQNVKPVRLAENVLILETHSPVWANKMRYCIKPTLVRLNRLGFKQIDTLKVKINPRLSEKTG